MLIRYLEAIGASLLTYIISQGHCLSNFYIILCEVDLSYPVTFYLEVWPLREAHIAIVWIEILWGCLSSWYGVSSFSCQHTDPFVCRRCSSFASHLNYWAGNACMPMSMLNLVQLDGLSLLLMLEFYRLVTLPVCNTQNVRKVNKNGRTISSISRSWFPVDLVCNIILLYTEIIKV